MTLQDLIGYFKYASNLTNAEFASEIGVSQATLSRWESGEIKSLNTQTKKRLSEFLDIDVDDYLKYDLVKPILGVVKAGYNLNAVENIEDYVLVSSMDAKRGDYFLRVTGDSMIDAKIFPDSLIYVKEVDDVDSGSIAVVLINGEEATVKRVIKKDQTLILEAANPNVKARYFSEAEVMEIPIKIIGKVLYAKHDF
ncbi:MAG: helix-turn-helix domain-containing protein [Erysipelothrix sp.]|nr:helix-turn-helix domain-containing protein [Erysipelothrix sp.]